jgi:hypothetical protein
MGISLGHLLGYISVSARSQALAGSEMTIDGSWIAALRSQ